MEETQQAKEKLAPVTEALRAVHKILAEAAGQGCEECRLRSLAMLSDALTEVILWELGTCTFGDDA